MASLHLAQEIFNLIYPVGSVYISVNDTNPGTLFGGTWSKIENRFLVGAGSSYTAGSTGGASTHRHDFRIGLEQFYGMMVGDDLSNQGAWSYEQSKYSKSSGRNSSATPVRINNDLPYSSTREQADYIRYSDGDTQTASSLPPYLSVYIWKRTA